MREIFNAELSQLGTDLVAMSVAVHTAVTDASRALLTADTGLAERVISRDEVIDEAQRELDERAITLLARQQPVATDLRVVVSALRMSSTLERMGDLARHIAEIARLRYPAHAVPEPLEETMAAMAADAERVARQTTELLTGHDLAVAAQIERDDDELDRLHRSTFDILFDPRWAPGPRTAVDMTLLGRYYERFGDHGVSIARRVVFLVTGDLTEDATTAG